MRGFDGLAVLKNFSGFLYSSAHGRESMWATIAVKDGESIAEMEANAHP